MLGKEPRKRGRTGARGATAAALALALVLVLTGAPAVVGSGGAPVDQTPPAITGETIVGRTLHASPGTWTNSPTEYRYIWKRCGAGGSVCRAIASAKAPTYTAQSADAGSTLRVSVSASNASGHSAYVNSAATAVVTAEKEKEKELVQHLEYVFEDGLISVYSIDEGFKLVKTITIPQTEAGVRGVNVYPPKHMLYISYGGDGGGNGNGSVLAYDLVTEKVVWEKHYSTGIDSAALSPDGTRLYEPIGENSSGGTWNIINTAEGSIVGTIEGGTGPHNTEASADGKYVYLGTRGANFFAIYETATSKVRKIGPLIGTVRPFTVNAKNTVAFTTATEHIGFQVLSLTTNKVLYTESFGEYPKGFPISGPSHGITLSPDEKTLYVIDSVHKEVHVWNVAGAGEGVEPKEIGVVAVEGLSGEESRCRYDCGRGGWLQPSVDFRYVFVGDSGSVIETATRKVVTTLPTLLQTKKSLEVDWSKGLPVATSGRQGVGLG